MTNKTTEKLFTEEFLQDLIILILKNTIMKVLKALQLLTIHMDTNVMKS